MPGATTAAALYERARVSGHVKSQTTHLPRSQGTTVTPSGLLPSVRERLSGSRRAEIAAVVKARWIIELKNVCPRSSYTKEDEWQICPQQPHNGDKYVVVIEANQAADPPKMCNVVKLCYVVIRFLSTSWQTQKKDKCK